MCDRFDQNYQELSRIQTIVHQIYYINRILNSLEE